MSLKFLANIPGYEELPTGSPPPGVISNLKTQRVELIKFMLYRLFALPYWWPWSLSVATQKLNY